MITQAALSYAEQALKECAPTLAIFRAEQTLSLADVQLKLGNLAEAKRLHAECSRKSAGLETGLGHKLGIDITRANLLIAEGAFKPALQVLRDVASRAETAAVSQQIEIQQMTIDCYKSLGDTARVAACTTAMRGIKEAYAHKQDRSRNRMSQLEKRIDELSAFWTQRKAEMAAIPLSR